MASCTEHSVDFIRAMKSQLLDLSLYMSISGFNTVEDLFPCSYPNPGYLGGLWIIGDAYRSF